jgi:formiminoglutamase
VSSDDPLWPRAGASFATAPAEISLLGVPTWKRSISPTGAHLTPTAICDALMRYSTYHAGANVDLAGVIFDAGDVPNPDIDEQAVTDRVAELVRTSFVLALGGDNSATYAVALGTYGADIAHGGLITLDAHHDLRDGDSNGSPVRRLIEAGLPGSRVVQIGIADFANSASYADRAREYGITVISRADLRNMGMSEAVSRALRIAGAGGGAVHVDIDVDVCDRAVAPACPASLPGGISADDLRQAVFLLGADPRVRSLDVTEVDAGADAADGRTVRLAALTVLEAAAGRMSQVLVGPSAAERQKSPQ